MDLSHERRADRTPRVLTELPIELTHQGFDEPFEADGVDVGLGGLSLRAPYLPDVGERLRCRFVAATEAPAPSGRTIEAECEVVWSHDSGPHIGRFGVRFVNLDIDSERALVGLVHRGEMATEPGLGEASSDRADMISFDEGEQVPEERDEPHPNVELHVDGVASPITGYLKSDGDHVLRVEQELPFLRVGAGVSAIHGSHRRGTIDAVELETVDGIPRLVLRIACEKEADSDRSDGRSRPRAGELEASPASDSVRADGSDDHHAPAPNRFDTMPDSLETGSAPQSCGGVAPDPTFEGLGTSSGSPRPSPDGDAIAGPDLAGPYRNDAPPLAQADSESTGARVADEGVGSLPETGPEPSAGAWTKERLVVAWTRARAALLPAGRLVAQATMTGAKRAWVVLCAMLAHLKSASHRVAPSLVRAAGRARAFVGLFFRVLWARARGQAVDGGRARARRQTAPPPSRSNVAKMQPREASRGGGREAKKGHETDGAPAKSPPRNRRRTIVASVLAFAGTAFTVYALSPASDSDALPELPASSSAHDERPKDADGQATREGGDGQSADAPAPAPAAGESGTKTPSSKPPTSLEGAARPGEPGTVPPSSPYGGGSGEAELGDESEASPQETEAVATHFGATEVPGGRSFMLRMSQPVRAIEGVARDHGFMVTVPGALSLDRAGPIAAAHPAVERSMILNRGDHAELTIRFVDGRSPAYRVSARGRAIEIVLEE